MVTSIILINAERTRINEVAEQIAGLDGISEVYSVSGNYDLIAIARVASNEELADLVTKKTAGHQFHSQIRDHARLQGLFPS